MGEPWGFSGEPWENRGDFPENRGRTVGGNLRTVGTQNGPKTPCKKVKKKTVSAVVGALLTAVSFWPFLVARTVGEPWGPN